jgi:hypothetical protein
VSSCSCFRFVCCNNSMGMCSFNMLSPYHAPFYTRANHNTSQCEDYSTGTNSTYYAPFYTSANHNSSQC